MRFLTAGPLIGKISVLRRVFQVIELQACRRVFAPSQRDQDRERILVPPRSFVCTSPLAVTTVVGILDLRRVSSSSELKSFFVQHAH